MKRQYLFLLIILCGCSSSENDNINNPIEQTFMVSVTQDYSTVAIDQMVTLTATANETIDVISYSLDGGSTFPSSHSTNFGTTANLYFDFDTTGTKNIVFRVKNEEGVIVDKTVTITVEIGNAIKIQNLQLNSFFNMGETWDDEFSSTDSNRLADVFFALLKPKLNVFNGTRGSYGVWYESTVKQNELNLFWDLQNENLLINLDEVTPKIAFADDDGGGIAQDLMLGPPFDRTIPLVNYQAAQTNPVIIQEVDISLEYQMEIEW